MALAREIMGGGFSSGQAKAMGGGVNSSISAAGTTQTTATLLNTSINVITTAASLSGVRLPVVEIGDELLILNLGANTCIVYPDTGSTINALPANTGFQLASNTGCQVNKFTASKWVAFLSA